MATLVALVWASAVAIVFAVSGGNVSLVGLLAIGPFIAAAFARPSRVALVGLLAAFFALVISTPPHSYGELNHILRVVTMLAATARRDVDRLSARAAQRAALDSPLRDPERAAAAGGGRDRPTDAGHGTGPDDRRRPGPGGRRRLRRHARRAARRRLDVRPRRRAGQPAHPAPVRLRPDEPIDGVLDSAPDRGPRAGHHVALFAETLEELQRERPDIYCAVESNRFRALAVVPMVVSDHTIGVVVVHWDDDREISEPDRTFLFTMTGAAAQAVERARLTLTEFVNLERSQHLHQLSSALAAATTPGDVAHAAIAGGRRALGAQSAIVRVPAVGERGLACLASSGHPALLSRAMVPHRGQSGRVRLRPRADRGRAGIASDAACARTSSRRSCRGSKELPRAGHRRHRAPGRQRGTPRRPVTCLRGESRAERT